jgi:hypothetical protein
LVLNISQKVLDAAAKGVYVVIGEVDTVRNTPALLACLGMEPTLLNWYRKAE